MMVFTSVFLSRYLMCFSLPYPRRGTCGIPMSWLSLMKMAKPNGIWRRLPLVMNILPQLCFQISTWNFKCAIFWYRFCSPTISPVFFQETKRSSAIFCWEPSASVEKTDQKRNSRHEGSINGAWSIQISFEVNKSCPHAFERKSNRHCLASLCVSLMRLF